VKNEIKKYFIKNTGSFVALTEGDLNELCILEQELVQVPAILFLQTGSGYDGEEMVLSKAELKEILKATLYNSFN
jgi:hypothetical protein